MATQLTIYRELDDPSQSLQDWLDARAQLYVVEDKKRPGTVHYLIDNDTPRDQDITEEIVGRPPYRDERDRYHDPEPGCTKGFALFSEDDDGVWEAVGFFRSLDRAEEAKASARVVISTTIDGVDPDWDSMNGEPEAPRTLREIEESDSEDDESPSE